MIFEAPQSVDDDADMSGNRRAIPEVAASDAALNIAFVSWPVANRIEIVDFVRKRSQCVLNRTGPASLSEVESATLPIKSTRLVTELDLAAYLTAAHVPARRNLPAKGHESCELQLAKPRALAREQRGIRDRLYER